MKRLATLVARGWAPACLLGAALVLAWPFLASSRGQEKIDKSALKLLLSNKPDDETPVRSHTNNYNILRPNVPQEVFAYVKNDSPTTQKGTLQVLAGGVEVAALPFEAAKNDITPVPAPKVVEGAKTVSKELKGKVKFRLLDAGGKRVGKDLAVVVALPSNYIKSPTLHFYPPKDGASNQLVASMSADKVFKGPPCRVELVLRPDRIPGFDPGRNKSNVYAMGNLTRGNRLSLVAQGLRFSGAASKNGLVYLTVDGCERAFAFRTTFFGSGSEGRAQPIQEGRVRLDVPPEALPSAKFQVGIEADGISELEDKTGARLRNDEVRLRLELMSRVPDEKTNGKTTKEEYSEIVELRGDRDQRIAFTPVGPNGGLLFRPEVKDWRPTIDLSASRGKTRLRLRLLDAEGDPITRKTAGKQVVEDIKDIVLDDSPPENVRLLPEPAKAFRGRSVLLQADAKEGSSKIREVLFYIGKPGPGGKLPEDLVSAPGVPVKAKGKAKGWTASLPVARDQKSPLLVSVRFTNGVGLSQTSSREIEVVDAPPDKDGKDDKGDKAKKASIAGTVLEGELPQNGLTVTMTNALGKVTGAVKTADGGKFVFKDLEPGAYRLATTRAASMTRGEASVSVTAGEEKTGVEIKLFR